MSATTTEFRNMETGSAPEGPGPDGECGGGRRHALNFAALNEAVLYKELFLAYLGAALIEPVLAIAGMEEAEGASLVINAVTLLAICWWMWIITDAFDFSDVMQAYKYRIDFGDKVRGGGFDWIALGSDDRAARRRGVAGDLQRNFMLWFMIASIIAAWIPGTIQHRDVMHAYVILLLWTLMHHTCRRATSWGRSYWFTYLNPSAALMPLEYCLPLADVENTVDDLDFVASYREYIKDETGVALFLQA